MSAPNLALATDLPDDLESAIRRFIVDEANSLAPPTADRYAIVVGALFEFLGTVDVRHRLGPEIARHLDDERERLGRGAFLPALGAVSLLRMLPDFLDAARQRDYGWGAEIPAAREGVLEVTIGLRCSVLDPLLVRVEQGFYASIADAIDACLDPQRGDEDPRYPTWAPRDDAYDFAYRA